MVGVIVFYWYVMIITLWFTIVFCPCYKLDLCHAKYTSADKWFKGFISKLPIN